MSLKIVHVVVTSNFAGVERYIAITATELAARGHEVSVVGGDQHAMRRALGANVRWLPGRTPVHALTSLAILGRQDVCHAHMTVAEATAILGRPLHRASIVSTRHFAAPRGSSRVSRAVRPLISRGLAREVAAGGFIASRIERAPDAVLVNSVPDSRLLWRRTSRNAVVLQRLEQEKDTLTALRAWEKARLWEDGWSLRIVGRGSEKHSLERWAAARRLPNVVFVGWVDDVAKELAGAGMLVAPAPAEPLGLSVLEAMAAGVPVVAAAAGGHLETIGRVPGARLFSPHDPDAAAAAMRSLLQASERETLSRTSRDLAQREFSVQSHVDGLSSEYSKAIAEPRRSSRRADAASRVLQDIVACSLEPWDEVWRRNQFFVDELLHRNPRLRVLFVEPAADPMFDLISRRRPSGARLRRVGYDGRLIALKPMKVLPRRCGPIADALLLMQVRLASRALNFSAPILWVNDLTYAPLTGMTGWKTVYDVTDDWLLAPFPVRERARLATLDSIALRDASAVVVCSPALATSRGSARPVVLIPNGVDIGHFRRPRARPADLPQSPVAVYVGSLHESRLDVDLLTKLAVSLKSLHVMLIGPDSLNASSRKRLAACPNIRLTGPRPYADVPAYLQHCDVVIVPHLVNAFTDSLDPIKAYECLAVGTPAVATPVSGFRDLDGHIRVASREAFVEAVETELAAGVRASPKVELAPHTWSRRAEAFEAVLVGAGISTW